jgi:hypothetical protein
LASGVASDRGRILVRDGSSARAMTPIIGMSKSEGIYLSVDFRVTRGRELVDDATVKFLVVHYPPSSTCARLLRIQSSA